MKTILIGDSGVGKSCLLSRILGYGWASSVPPTDGIHYETWTGLLADRKYYRHFWDTSGTAHVKPLITSFIEDMTGIFLVFDVTNQASLQSLRDWYQVIQPRILNHARITLIGNKRDLRNERAIGHVTEMQCLAASQYMNARYFETSAKTNEGVQDVWGGWLSQMQLSR
ncbi:GTP-binding protein [Tulasnella sp. 331]|nr:GTP-binding protein [Tulasnella sp. 331]